MRNELKKSTMVSIFQLPHTYMIYTHIHLYLMLITHSDLLSKIIAFLSLQKLYHITDGMVFEVFLFVFPKPF